MLSPGRVEGICNNVHCLVEQLKGAARSLSVEELKTASHSLADAVHQLSGHCNVTLVNDALRDWHSAQEKTESKLFSPEYAFLELKDNSVHTHQHRQVMQCLRHECGEFW